MAENAVIVGSRRGVRHLDFTRSYPDALEPITEDRPALDWVLTALRQTGHGEIAFVGGYHIQKIIERYPGLRYLFQADWQRLGEVSALLLARQWLIDGCVVCRSDTVILPAALQSAAATRGDCIACTHLAGGFGSTTPEVALLLLRPPAAAAIVPIAEEFLRESPGATLEELVDRLERTSLRICRLDVSAHAASVHDRAAVARLIIGGKAQTLERLRPLLEHATILAQTRFTVREWRADPASIAEQIAHNWRDKPVVVRSSSLAEDSWSSSQAGRFESVLGVPASDRLALERAIESVVASFAEAGVAEDDNQVFVQEQVQDAVASGVLFTRDPETGAPYYVINLNRSERTDVVTGGRAGSIEKIVVLRPPGDGVPDPDVRRLVAAAQETETLTFHDAIDVEFAFDAKGALYFLQVRPLTTLQSGRRFVLAPDDLVGECARVEEHVGALARRKPTLLGPTTVLGVMPDWNPAEMTGTTPRPLALALYQRLIGDRTWAEARALMGYRDATLEPLIVSLAGRPYVDVRASLNSFLPAELPNDIGERLITHQLDRLARCPELHDKIEFRLTHTCLAFDFEPEDERLLGAGLRSSELIAFRDALRALTDRMVRGVSPRVDRQLDLVSGLGERCASILRAAANTPAMTGWAVHTLLEECRRYGTVPFAILARYAFVSMEFLFALRRRGVLTQQELDSTMHGIPSVAGELARDHDEYLAGRLPQEAFLVRYGHLRPSSYDITSPSYGSAPDLYLAHADRDAAPSVRTPTEESQARAVLAGHREEIGALLRNAGFQASATQLEDFIIASIPARERAKFEFTKLLHALLETVAAHAESLGFTRDDASYLSLERIARMASDSSSTALRTETARELEYSKKRWNLTCSLQLPPLLCSPGDVAFFRVREAMPNFVTTQRVVARTARLDGGTRPEQLAGKIALIERADPGFDWIFAHDIAGLVTCYGGMASHMAIRAAEFRLPAAIGCGELIYQRALLAKLLDLDCCSRQLRVVR